MQENPKTPISCRMDNRLLKRLDKYIKAQTVAPTRARVVEVAVAEFLAREAQK